MTAVALFVFFALKPKKPQFELQQVSVHYLIFTTSSAATYLSLNISLLFTASNPNKVGIKYSPADLYVMYKGVPLGVARVPAFFQPAHSLSSFSAGVAVDRLDVSTVNAADLVRDAAVNDRVDLNVVGDVAARIRVLDINSPKVKVTPHCTHSFFLFCSSPLFIIVIIIIYHNIPIISIFFPKQFIFI